MENVASLPDAGKKLARADGKWPTYIRLHPPFIPTYGARRRNPDMIASGFPQSAVHQMGSKRMVKRQQMDWTTRGAHLLPQMRAKVLNKDWDQTFRGWYPGFRTNEVGRQAA